MSEPSQITHSKRTDFRRFDIAAVERALQGIALAALDDCLVGNPDRPRLVLAKAELGALLDCLGPELPETFAEANVSKRFARIFLMNDPPGTSRLQTSVLRLIFPLRWFTWLADQILRIVRRRPAEGPAGAGKLIDPIAHTAWSDMSFRMAVATRVRDVLAAEVLFHPSPAPCPEITPEAWWLLIDLTMPSPEPGRAARMDRIRRGVANRAAQAIEASGWAGFWEQYLLLRLYRRTPEKFDERLRSLPCLRPDDDASSAAQDDDPPQVRKGWRAERPGYAVALLRGTL